MGSTHRRSAEFVALFVFFLTGALAQQAAASPNLTWSSPSPATSLTEVVRAMLTQPNQNQTRQAPPELEVGRPQRAARPVAAEARISSRFGPRRSLQTGRPSFHSGTDFHARRGSPVYSVRPGIVELVTRNHEHDNGMGGYGNGVVLYHPDDDLWSFYAHLQRVEVAVGDVVVAGQRIGRVGNTSNGRFRGMAVHLHLEVRQRTAEGLSPFPGLYGPNNRDPEAWLARHGLHYDADGRPRANEQRLAGNNNAEIPQPEPPEANGDGRAEVLNRARPRQRPN